MTLRDLLDYKGEVFFLPDIRDGKEVIETLSNLELDCEIDFVLSEHFGGIWYIVMQPTRLPTAFWVSSTDYNKYIK